MRILHLVRKPLNSTVAETVLTYGTGALNINDSRIPFLIGEESPSTKRRIHGYATNPNTARQSNTLGLIQDRGDPVKKAEPRPSEERGRYPSNLILVHNHSQLPCPDTCPVHDFDAQAGHRKSGMLAAHHGRTAPRLNGDVYGKDPGQGATAGRNYYGDEGTASRFFKQVYHESPSPRS